MKVDPVLARKIVYWFRRLKRVIAVARRLRIRCTTVTYVLHRLGIRKKPKVIKDSQIERRVISWYKKLSNTSAVAKKLGISQRRVSRILKKNNVEVKIGRIAKRRPNMNAAQKKLFNGHIQLVKVGIKSVGAWRARRAGMDVDDLYSAGLIGLWRAAMTFDKSIGCSFATLAYKLIKYEMLDAIEISRFGRRNTDGKLIDQSAFLSYEDIRDDKVDDEF